MLRQHGKGLFSGAVACGRLASVGREETVDAAGKRGWTAWSCFDEQRSKLLLLMMERPCFVAARRSGF
jgi:hypothetical protein